MQAQTVLYDFARNLLYREWGKLCGNASTNPICAMMPTEAVVREMVDLLAETHEQGIEELRSAIHSCVFDSLFVDEGGDSMVLDELLEQVEAHVTFWISLLKEVRDYAIRQGLWSDAPITPQMFG
jgi:ketopantoate reductase